MSERLACGGWTYQMADIFNLCDAVIVKGKLCEVGEALQIGDGANRLEIDREVLDLSQAHASPLLRC